MQSGDFCTYVPAAWGTECLNPADPVTTHEAVGCMRDANFSSVFPISNNNPDGGIHLGEYPPDYGNDEAYTLDLLTSGGVLEYLSAQPTQPPAPLTGDLSYSSYSGNGTSANILGQEVSAMDLNFGFDLGGVWLENDPPPTLGGQLFFLEYVSCQEDLDPLLVGERIATVRQWANCAFSGRALVDCGIPAGIDIEDLNQAVSVFNRNFENCQANLGCLDLIQAP